MKTRDRFGVSLIASYAAPPPPPPPTYAPPAVKEKTALPTVAGILLIVAGILALGSWMYTLAVGAVLFFFFGWILMICGVIGIIFSIFALLGGIMALRRKLWGLALTGSILGLFTVGPYFIASILSLVGLILLAVSHEEFK